MTSSRRANVSIIKLTRDSVTRRDSDDTLNHEMEMKWPPNHGEDIMAQLRNMLQEEEGAEACVKILIKEVIQEVLSCHYLPKVDGGVAMWTVAVVDQRVKHKRVVARVAEHWEQLQWDEAATYGRGGYEYTYNDLDIKEGMLHLHFSFT